MALIYKVSGTAIYDIKNLGKDTNGNSATNFANQLMADAKLVGMKDGKRQFESKGGKYLLTVHASEKLIERIALRESATVESLPEFHGQYTATTHAMCRFRERFAESASNKTDAQINHHLNELLKTATLHSTTANSRGVIHNYDSFKHNMRIIIAKNTLSIVTVHQLKDEAAPVIEKDSPLFGAIIAATKRELNKARAAFRKTNRELVTQMATVKVEIATAMVSKVNAKGEHIVSAVDRRLAELKAVEAELAAKIEAEQKRYERVEADAKRVIGG